MVLRGACRSIERVSSATLTIVVSRTAMMSPRMATPATTSVGRSSPPERRSTRASAPARALTLLGRGEAGPSPGRASQVARGTRAGEACRPSSGVRPGPPSAPGRFSEYSLRGTALCAMKPPHARKARVAEGVVDDQNPGDHRRRSTPRRRRAARRRLTCSGYPPPGPPVPRRRVSGPGAWSTEPESGTVPGMTPSVTASPLLAPSHLVRSVMPVAGGSCAETDPAAGDIARRNRC
jgi:hypothetical protein